MFIVGETVASSGSCQTAPFNFQLLPLSVECLYEISENTCKDTFSVMISIQFSHYANLLQEDLIWNSILPGVAKLLTPYVKCEGCVTLWKFIMTIDEGYQLDATNVI
jgi:hypothetical protein